MTTLAQAVDQVLRVQVASGKPLAIIVAGHNGSGKSTMWNERLAPGLQMPLINADRMMLSILPEPRGRFLTAWAQKLRDEDENWMAVAQQGVDAFIVQAMSRCVRFPTETVFSHWQDRGDGAFASKIDRIRQLQQSGYFVLLLFVGLTDAQLSIGRVTTRVASGEVGERALRAGSTSVGRQRSQHAKHPNRAKCRVGPELLEQLSSRKQRLVFGCHAFPF